MAKRDVYSVWDYYTVAHGHPEVAECDLCSIKIKRGATGAPSKKISTESLCTHLQSKHKDEHSSAIESKTLEAEKKEKKKQQEEEKARVYALNTSLYQTLNT